MFGHAVRWLAEGPGATAEHFPPMEEILNRERTREAFQSTYMVLSLIPGLPIWALLRTSLPAEG